jgi:hypothetical protein
VISCLEKRPLVGASPNALTAREAAMNELVFFFLTWIAAETGLATPPPPSIQLISTQEMHTKSGRPSGAASLYMRATATVHLPTGWNSTKIYDRAMLLHELVHHVQEINRVPSQCNAERERQAYDLTLEWLRNEGVADPYALLNLDELTITILSSCPIMDGRSSLPVRA